MKSAVAYILVQLCMKTPQNSLPASLMQTVCRFVSSNLASAKSHDLTLNLLGTAIPLRFLDRAYNHFSPHLGGFFNGVMRFSCAGLVKGILKSSAYSQCLLQTDRLTSEAKGTRYSHPLYVYSNDGNRTHGIH